jgi:hypothetical protein
MSNITPQPVPHLVDIDDVDALAGPWLAVFTPRPFDSWKRTTMMMMLMVWLILCLRCSSLLVLLIPGRNL